MSNNSLIPQKYSFILKIKTFLNKLIKKYKKNDNIEHIKLEEDIINNEKIQNKSNFSEQLKEVIDTTHDERENFLKELNENPSLLEKLSMERLEKLSDIYDNIINENNQKINRLKLKKGIS